MSGVMSTVQTVLGPMPLAQLGRTLVHEHLYIAFDGAALDPTAPFDRTAFVAEAVRRLKELVALGVKTFVDPCPIDLGRDATLLREVSEKSGMQIVCTTGFYNEHSGLPAYWRARTAEEIAALYIHEIEHGIGDTGIRPGAIKCATGAPAITALEDKFLTATSLAQRASGLPIITHTDHVCGPEQQAVFARNGVPLHRCLIGHSCGNADPAYHRRIAEAGSYVGFDRIGMKHHQSDQVRADNIVRLVRGGHASRVLMSQDRYCFYRGGFMNPVPAERLKLLEQLRQRGKWPPPYTYLFTDFIPMLRERGLGDEEIWPILDRNPAEFFSGAAR
jgi:phosphotriesterase-related protein